MTTEVRVYPAGHKVEVAMTEKTGPDTYTRTVLTTLNPGDPAYVTYVYTGRSVIVSEVEN